MTVEQINLMKHCIGFEQRYVKRGKYEAYRNYFNNGDEPDEDWEELVSQGYAKKSILHDQFIYFVTLNGKKLLEEILDVVISEGD